MLLNLKRSALLLQVLPQTGSIAEQILCKEVKEKVSLFFEEIKEKTGLKIGENGVGTFDPSKDENREFDFSESETHVLKRGVNHLDEKGLVTVDILDLCQEILSL
jgi:hypothetical protein